MSQSFRDLIEWQRAMEMTTFVYEATQSFPRQEVFGLTSQLLRSAVSVASNIAEGRGRLTRGEFRQFLGMAQGSNFAVQTQLLVAQRLGMGSLGCLNKAECMSVEVGKMLSSLIGSVQAKS